MSCPKCGGELAPSRTGMFCVRCGAEFDMEGREVEGFGCPECGVMLKYVEVVREMHGRARVTPSGEVEEEEMFGENVSYYCPECGANISEYLVPKQRERVMA